VILRCSLGFALRTVNPVGLGLRHPGCELLNNNLLNVVVIINHEAGGM